LHPLTKNDAGPLVRLAKPKWPRCETNRVWTAAIIW